MANVVYLGLSFAGGLWTTPAALPEAVERLSVVLPTRAYADLLAGAALNARVGVRAWLVLAAYALASQLVGRLGLPQGRGAAVPLRFGHALHRSGTTVAITRSTGAAPLRPPA